MGTLLTSFTVVRNGATDAPRPWRRPEDLLSAAPSPDAAERDEGTGGVVGGRERRQEGSEHGGSFISGCSGCLRHGGALLRQHRTTEVSLGAQDAVRMRAHGSRSDVYMPDLYEDFKVSRGSLRPDWAAHARCGRIVASCPAPGPETTVRPIRSRR